MPTLRKPLTGISILLAATLAACASAPGTQGNTGMTAGDTQPPASAEERAMANRADPLTRASFWSAEYNRNTSDPDTAIEFASALRAIGSHQRAEEIISTTLVLNPGNTDLLMMSGRIRMSAADYVGGRSRFEEVVRTDPLRAEAWAALGTAHDQMGRHEAAQEAYRKALDIEPARITTLTNYGLSLLLSGDLAGAEIQLRAAARDPMAPAMVHENLALALGLQGRFEEMKQVSAAYAPGEAAEHNAALLQTLLHTTGNDAGLSGTDLPATRLRTTRRLRGSLN